MSLLLRAALENRRHLILLLVTTVAMILATVSTQMEMFAIKIMTTKGVDAFELFAPETEGALVKGETIRREDVNRAMTSMDPDGSGEIRKEDAERYLASFKKNNILDRMVEWVSSRLSLVEKPTHLLALLLTVAILNAIALFANRYSIRLVAIKVSRDLRQRYFEHIQSLPISFYQKSNMGQLTSRVLGDAHTIASAINSILINCIQTPFALISTLTICFLTSWRLSLIVFIGAPLLILPIWLLSHLVRRISRRILQNQERFTSVLLDFLGGIQTIKIFGSEAFSLKKYRDQNDQMMKLEERSARYACSARPLMHAMSTLFLAGIFIYGLYFLHMPLSSLLFFSALLIVLYEPVKKFAEENTSIQRGVVAAERMYEVLDIHPEIEDLEDAEELQSFDDEIRFSDVHFRYDDQWVLQGLSFTVKKGEVVAIVGPTGAGKSTIVNLLPRLYDVQKGVITIDGKPLQAYTQKSIRKQIAFVPQKPFLFLDSVAENIAFGESYTEEELQVAAERAHAHEFISRMPEGYQTELAESGKNLSGGQQQRLAIARALFKKASVLIMDEATSSLDAVSEGKIKTAVEELRGDLTQIIIAHRLTTIENADRIIYLDRGQKLAEGTRDELLESCPEFRAMWEMMYRQSTEKTA